MKVKLAVLADYANTSKEGKLNIMGIFSRILSGSFPARHPQCHLVISCALNEFDLGKTCSHRIRMMNADGQVLMNLEGQVEVAANSRAGDFNLILCLNQLMFPAAGDYEFRIDIGETNSFPVPFTVTKLGEPGK